MVFESEFLPQITSFLFVFALIYALLIYSKLFTESKNAAAVLSIVIAFFSVMYSPLVVFLQSIIPIAALILVFLFFLVLIKRLVIEKEGVKDALPIVVILAIFLLLVGVLWNEIALTIPGLSSENLLWIIGIIIIILIFFAAYSHKPREEPQPQQIIRLCN